MTTNPSDLVLDITCGSGTTAYVAEQWGRRWITCDTSRIAIELAKERLMTATYDYYKLAHPEQGVSSGFIYKTVPHITLKSIANNEPPAEETEKEPPVSPEVYALTTILNELTALEESYRGAAERHVAMGGDHAGRVNLETTASFLRRLIDQSNRELEEVKREQR